ncbi:MAG: hypothetical protein ABI945_07520 [Nitrospirales bacterium]
MEHFPQAQFFTGIRIMPGGGRYWRELPRWMKIRLHPTFSLLLTTWSPLFTEEDFTVKVDGIKNGRVRAVRRVCQSLNLGTFFPDVPSGTGASRQSTISTTTGRSMRRRSSDDILTSRSN